MSQTVDFRSRRVGASAAHSNNMDSAASTERVPPHNLHAEESLLGAMLLSRDAIGPAVETCAAADFYKPAHAHIFEAIVSLWGKGEPADPVTVADELTRADLLDAIGGTSTLISLQANTPATSNAARYARIIEEHSLLRRLIRVAGEISEMGYSVPEDITATVDHAEAMVFDVAQRRVADTLLPIRELLSQSLDRLEALYDRGEAITGVPTGFTDLDDRLSGLQPSALIIVGARPAMGKCVAWDTPIVDPTTGAVLTAAEVHRRGEAGELVDVFSLDETRQLRTAQPSAFVDDGVKPVFSVRTRLGRHVRTTLSHPFLTPDGWTPLGSLTAGCKVAVPRRLPVFGIDALPETELGLLAYLLSEGGKGGEIPTFTSSSEDAINEAAFTAWSIGARALRQDVNEDGTTTIVFLGQHDRVNPVGELLRRYGLLTCSSANREIPEAIFRLPKPQMSYFLRRLMTIGGRVVLDLDDLSEIQWSTSSRLLAQGIQHLLLRFGLNAQLRAPARQGLNYVIALTETADIRRFAHEIGLLGQENDLDILVSSLVTTPSKTLVGATLASTSPTRATSVFAPTLWEGGALKIDEMLGRYDDEELSPDADIRWDEIVSIDYDGDEQVYDLTIPLHHNFVAGDVVVHNTAFALNVVSHAALTGVPTLFFSLEMSHLEITQRLLCAEGRVDASRLRNGRLHDSDWPKINHAIGRLGEAPIFIDDNPNVTVMDIRAKARRLKASPSGLGLVVIDYLQLMSGRSNAENRQVEVSEMSRGLKILARELNVPVIALSQLSRNLEMRADKRPLLADLRESGCLTASTRIRRADNGSEVTIGELFESQEKNVPVWTLDDDWKLSTGVMTHAFSSGIKPVFKLHFASGRKVEATANHPFRSINGWTALEHLKVGSRVAVPRLIPEPENCKRWSEAEVVMLAHLLRGGNLMSRQPISYTSDDLANVVAVEQAAEHWNITPRRAQCEGSWQAYLPAPRGLRGRASTSNPLQTWWRSFGLDELSSEQASVPKAVFSLPNHQIRLFLQHLWANGGCLEKINNSDSTVNVEACYVSTSRRFVENVQSLLLRLGIYSCLSAVSGNEGVLQYSVKILHPEHVRAFIEEVGIHGRRGECAAEFLQYLDGKSRAHMLPGTTHGAMKTATAPIYVPEFAVDVIPFGVKTKIAEAIAHEGITYEHMAKTLAEQYGEFREKASGRERLEQIAHVLSSKELLALAEADVFWDEIVEIENLGEQPVFDATVLGTHNFLANDVVVHNSLEQDADVVMFLYRDEVYSPESPDKGTAEIIVSKHRNGPVGTTQLAFIDRYTRFANMAKV